MVVFQAYIEIFSIFCLIADKQGVSFVDAVFLRHQIGLVFDVVFPGGTGRTVRRCFRRSRHRVTIRYGKIFDLDLSCRIRICQTVLFEIFTSIFYQVAESNLRKGILQRRPVIGGRSRQCLLIWLRNNPVCVRVDFFVVRYHFRFKRRNALILYFNRSQIFGIDRINRIFLNQAVFRDIKLIAECLRKDIHLCVISINAIFSAVIRHTGTKLKRICLSIRCSKRYRLLRDFQTVI